jgi:hypothetical protein
MDWIKAHKVALIVVGLVAVVVVFLFVAAIPGKTYSHGCGPCDPGTLNQIRK